MRLHGRTHQDTRGLLLNEKECQTRDEMLFFSSRHKLARGRCSRLQSLIARAAMVRAAAQCSTPPRCSWPGKQPPSSELTV